MKKSRLVIPVVGLATLLGGVFAGRRTIERWRQNPDPLDGEPVRFPDAVEGTVALEDGAEIATYSVGSGPTIVVVHGLTASHHDWGPIAPHLVDAGYRVLAIDQRGHGRSTSGTSGYGSTQLGDDLAAIFLALDLKAVCLMGHSMGAMASMGFAAGHPTLFKDRVASFVSIASTGATDSVRQGAALRLGGLPVPDRLSHVEADRLRLLAGPFVLGRRPSLHMVDQAIEAFRRCPEDVRAPATAALTDHDVLDELATLPVPTLVVGAGRDHLVSMSQVEELHETLPDSRLHTYPDAGHMVIWERHEDLAKRVLDFLQTTVESPTDRVR